MAFSVLNLLFFQDMRRRQNLKKSREYFSLFVCFFFLIKGDESFLSIPNLLANFVIQIDVT